MKNRTVGEAIAAAEAEGRITDQARRELASTSSEPLSEEVRQSLLARLPDSHGETPCLFDIPADVVVLDGLPFPPSVNDYLMNLIIPRVKGQGIGNAKAFRIQTFPSDAAKAFREQCLAVVKQARPPKLKGFLRCEVVFFAPNHIRRDLDNMPKCLLDGLKHAELFDDDSQIRELSLKWGPLKPPHGKTAIRLTTLGA